MRLNPFRRRQKDFVVLGTDGQPITPDGDAEKIGSGRKLSLLMAPVGWIARSVSGVPLDVTDVDGEPVEAPELAALLDRDLLYAVAADYTLYGNSYLEIERGPLNQPVGLRYLAPAWVSPKGAAGAASSLATSVVLYEVQMPRGTKRDVLPQDIIHFKVGIDPDAPLTGVSPLKILVQEALSDMEASKITKYVLQNRGIMGMVVSPKEKMPARTEEARKAFEAELQNLYTAKNRGKAFAANYPLDVTSGDVKLNDFALEIVRGVPEERVCAVLGVQPAIVGFGSGLRQTRVGATLEAERRTAWESVVLPTLDTLLAALNDKVAAEFGDNVKWSYSIPPGHIAAENAKILAQRTSMLYEKGIMTLNEARAAIGLPDLPDGDRVLTEVDSSVQGDGDE